MSSYLLALHIGPAQAFISRARRLRDLWFGSFLLSDLSKAVARALNMQGHKLIIPHADILQNLLAPPNTNGDEWQKVPAVVNVLLAKVQTDNPAKLAEEMETEAKERLMQWARSTLEDARALIRDQTVWQAQLDDALEFHAAWVPWPDDADGYKAARQRVMTLLAASQGHNTFGSETEDDTGLPKSSLDGLRPTVLKKADVVQNLPRPPSDSNSVSQMQRLAYRLRLARNEQLDAIGLIKRAATGRTLASATRVALDAWLRGIDVAGSGSLDGVYACMKQLSGRSEPNLASGSGKEYRDSAFWFDGQLLLKDQLLSRLRNLKNNAELDGLTMTDVPVLKTLLHHVNKLYTAHGEPFPYYALIAADGDGLGKALENVQSHTADQGITAKLSVFSNKVNGIVNRHHGLCLYAGGDDVLAAVPLDQMLACADELQQEYFKAMQASNDKDPGSLSVGIAIAHALEPLEDVRQWALAAERSAKNKDEAWPGSAGNALALHWHSRSGSPMQLRGSWLPEKDQVNNLRHRLTQWVHCLEKDLISDKSAFALESLAKSYALPGHSHQAHGELTWDDANQARKALQAQARYLLNRTGADKNEEKAMALNAADQAIADAFAQDRENPHRALHHLAREWQIARHLLKAQQQVAGRSPKKDTTIQGEAT